MSIRGTLSHKFCYYPMRSSPMVVGGHAHASANLRNSSQNTGFSSFLFQSLYTYIIIAKRQTRRRDRWREKKRRSTFFNVEHLATSKNLYTFAFRNNSNLDSIGYQVMKSKTNKKNIMKKDEFVDLMRQQGWTAEEVKEMVEVPLYGCVRAGVPDEYGDNPHETGSIPMEYVSGKCWLVVVQGDSMRDYDLHEGDHLLVRTQDVARSGEIVVAHYDGGPTVKTYFEDEDGSKWLTPGNDKYQAMRIDETHECRIFGVVQTIIHEHPLGDPADCVRYVRKAKEDEGAQFSQQTIARALKETLGYIQCKRHWFAVFAVLRDLRVVSGLNEFTDLLSEIMGEEAPDLNLKDLGRLNVMSFRKPVRLWDENDSPAACGRFQAYREIARRFHKKLLK